MTCNEVAGAVSPWSLVPDFHREISSVKQGRLRVLRELVARLAEIRQPRDMLEMLIFAMLQWGLLTAMIARSKNRDVGGWFAVGAVLPVFGLVLAITATAKPRTARPTVATA